MTEEPLPLVEPAALSVAIDALLLFPDQPIDQK